MPIVNITLIEGRSDEQKSAIFKEVTEALHRAVGTPYDNIRIILNEVPAKHFAVAGVTKTGPSGDLPSPKPV